MNLPELSPPSMVYHFQTVSLPTKAAMDAAFPFGMYTFATNTADTANFSYTADDYAQSFPFLTGTDFTSLQGMDPANPFTFHISPFTTGAMASSSFIFLTIFDFTSNAFVYNSGFLPKTTTNVTIPANTLNFGDSFVSEIDFSNRDIVLGTGANFLPQLGFDLRSDGDFRTEPRPVPEPSAAALCGVGLVALMVVFFRRKDGGGFAIAGGAALSNFFTLESRNTSSLAR